MQEKGHPSPTFAVACRRRYVRKAGIRFRATPCSRTASSGRRLSFRGRKTLWKLPCLRLPSCRRGTRKKSSVPCLPAHRERHRKRAKVPMSGSCRIAGIVHSGHAHSMTGTFFFCRNRHPLMRDDAFLLHVLCLPLSPAQACIGEVPSSASCIGRPSSALHVRLLRLKLSHKKRDDIDADNSSFLAKNAVQAKSGRFTARCRLSLFSLLWMQIVFFLLFFFAFLSPVSFSSDAVLHARGVFFFSFTTEEKKEGRCLPFSLPFFLGEGKEKTPVQGREKALQAIFLRRFSFSFFVFSLLRSSSAFLFLEKRKRKKKGMPQTRENSAFRNGKVKEEETDVLGIRFLPFRKSEFSL